MNIKIPSLDNARKNAQAKMLEGYEKMGKLIEDGSVDPLYPENPAVDAAQIAASTPDKPVTVNSELLRDLLNWATSADPASIDAVVAKAEELAVSGPMGPEKLIDLTGAAGCQQPGCDGSKPAIPGNEVPAVGTQTTPGMPIPAGPTGPLSPVMSSYLRRGKKVQEGMPCMKGIKKECDVIPGTSNEPVLTPSEMGKGKNPETRGVTPRWTAAKEDDVIPGVAHEPIVNPDEMGKKNPGVKPDGGQDPEGMSLEDPMNKGNAGLQEDGLELGDGEAAEIGSELDAEGGAEGMGDVDGGVSVAPGGEEIGIAGDGVEPVEGGGPEVTPEIEPMDSMAPVAPAAPAGGMVQQLSDMQARIAELEAIIKGGAAPAPVAPVDGAMDAVADVTDMAGDLAGSLEGGLDDVEAGAAEGAEDTDELEAGEGEEGEEGEEKGENPFAKGDEKEDDAEEDKEEGEKEEKPEEKE